MNKAILTDIYDFDFGKVDPKASQYDFSLQLANVAVEAWLKKPENRRYLQAKQSDRIHGGGLSVGKNMKEVCDIPEEAFFLLPVEIRNDKKEIMKWIRRDHPYLLFSGNKWNY